MTILAMEARKIRKYLAQMTEIGAFELILDQNGSTFHMGCVQYIRRILIYGDLQHP